MTEDMEALPLGHRPPNFCSSLSGSNLYPSQRPTHKCKYSAFLSPTIHSSELQDPEGVVGTPKFVASWSEVRLAPGTSKLVAGVRFSGILGGLKGLCA